MSELGAYGLLSVNYNHESLSDNNNQYFTTFGVYLIPLLGGVGYTWKHYFNSSRISPFTSLTGFGAFALPVMCSKCDSIIGDLLVSGSIGVDYYVTKKDWINIHFQLGIMSQYSLTGGEVFESPSDIPEIWPVINIKFKFDY